MQNLVKLICDLNMMKQQMVEIGYDAKKLPLGKLSKKTIQVQRALSLASSASLVLPRPATFHRLIARPGVVFSGRLRGAQED